MSGLILVACENRAKAVPYLDALRELGVDGERLRLLTPDERPDHLEPLAATAAGLVLCGGPDLDPRRYGEEPRPDAKLHVIPELDDLDWRLLLGAREGRTPVWAICRGLQTFNVQQGGTLWQDIYSQVEGVLDHDVDETPDAPAHPVKVVDRRESFGELLAGSPRVNSRHHQAIRKLGRDLVAVAESPDGLIEVAVLDSADWWVKGVQWHPENLLHIPLQRRLWQEFLQTAGFPGSAVHRPASSRPRFIH